MNVNKEIKKNMIYYIVMTIMGIIALFIGYVLDFQRHTMTGMAIGFLPVGLGGMLIYSFAKNKPSMIQKIKLENEERNVFIRNKSGLTAFWIVYWYVFIVTMSTNFLYVSAGTLGIVTLIFMPIVYFTVEIIYHYKY